MSNQLFDNGDTLEKDGIKLECIAVTYRERDGGKENFVYSFRDAEEVKQERKDSENPVPTEPSEGEQNNGN